MSVLVLLKLIFSNQSKIILENKKYLRGMTGNAILPSLPPTPLPGRRENSRRQTGSGWFCLDRSTKVDLAKEFGCQEISKSWQGVPPEHTGPQRGS